jgi:hypothetical protein
MSEKSVPLWVGVIAGLDSTGFGIIVDAQDEQRPFSLASLVHYRGQSVASLGLTVGQRVVFGLIDNKVAFIDSNLEASSSSAAASAPKPNPRS